MRMGAIFFISFVMIKKVLWQRRIFGKEEAEDVSIEKEVKKIGVSTI